MWFLLRFHFSSSSFFFFFSFFFRELFSSCLDVWDVGEGFSDDVGEVGGDEQMGDFGMERVSGEVCRGPVHIVVVQGSWCSWGRLKCRLNFAEAACRHSIGSVRCSPFGPGRSCGSSGGGKSPIRSLMSRPYRFVHMCHGAFFSSLWHGLRGLGISEFG